MTRRPSIVPFRPMADAAAERAETGCVRPDGDEEAGAGLTILIPAYNEAAGIGATLAALAAEPRLQGAEVIVVDDGSSDETAEIARAHGATVVSNWTNLGYGASLKRGLHEAHGDWIAWFDADGQHRPSDLAAMFAQARRERLDAVVGTRQPGSHVVRSRVLGKRVIRWAADAAVGRKIPDVNCGLRVFRTQVLETYADILPDGFSASTTSTLLLLKRSHAVRFHPIETGERIGKSTVRQVRDGLRTLHTILRITVMFNAFRTFSWAAAAFIFVGVVYGLTIGLIRGAGFPVLGALSIILGVQIFCLGIVCDQISAMRLERLARSDPSRRRREELKLPSEMRPRRAA